MPANGGTSTETDRTGDWDYRPVDDVVFPRAIALEKAADFCARKTK